MQEETGSLDASQESYLLAQKVRALYVHAPTSNLTVLAISVLCFFMLRNRLDPELLGGWTALMCTAATFRLLLWYRHKRRSEATTDRRWLRYYTIGSAIVGISWSLVYLFLHSLDDVVVVVVVALLMLIFGVLSSSVAILSVHLPAFFFYVAPQVCVLGGTLLSQRDHALGLLTIALAAYLAMLISIARNANCQFLETMRLADKNRMLVEKLNGEVAQRQHVIDERTEALSNSNTKLEREVSERKLAENNAKVQYGLLRAVLDATPDLIFYKDYRNRNGAYLGGNRAFAEFVGKPMDEIIGNDDLKLFGEDIGSFFREKDRQMLQSGNPQENEEWVTYPDGRRVLLSTLKTQFYDQGKEAIGVLGVSRDITKQKEAEEALRHQQQSLHHLAHHDPLTNLPNRLLLIDRLSQSIEKAKRNDEGLAIFFVDLDHFKEINDSLGHTVGDQLLKAVSHRLLDCVRREDTVARLGGDEFTILVEQAHDSAAVGKLAGKVLTAFRDHFKLLQHELSITASIGISLFPANGEDTETLLRNADAAMYRAKSEGRNAYRFYSADMTEQALARVAIETALRKALSEHQFVLHYQPQFDIRSERLIGCEALVRWMHPQHGLLPPDRFVPIAEESGLISQIGEWVLAEACAQIAEWRKMGLPHFRVSVNLSGRQLLSDQLIDVVEKTLTTTGCSPEWLALEITEGFLIQQPEKSRAKLQVLRDMGVEIAVDDFGTGYSSLSYLKQFPISRLKIDYSFVRDIPVDHNDRAISSAIIALGKSLGLSVIAEGVECREQADFLIAKGCNEAQGFLYGKPVPSEEFAASCEHQNNGKNAWRK